MKKTIATQAWDAESILYAKAPTPRAAPLCSAHLHEIGHLLGLSHVDVGKKRCLAANDTNAVPCYGIADRDKYAVMGDGMQLRDECANPWRRAIAQISGKGNAAVKTDWAPKRVRQYPRTLPEVAAGTSITASPKR